MSHLEVSDSKNEMNRKDTIDGAIS